MDGERQWWMSRILYILAATYDWKHLENSKIGLENSRFLVALLRATRRDSSSHVSVRPWQKKNVGNDRKGNAFLQAGLTNLDEIWHDGRS